ncbi:MAG: tetratricopeptide repeat protein [bacterium]|nr:tetratricopeptide repeat protein [bacterium]
MRGLRNLQIVAAVLVGCLFACGSPEVRKEAAVEKAAEAIRIGDLVSAEAEIKAYLQFAPRDIDARTRLAKLLSDQGLNHEALRLITTLPAGTELDESSRLLLGRLLLSDNQLRRCGPLLVALERDAALEPGLKAGFLEAVANYDPVMFIPSLPASWLKALIPLYLQNGCLSRSIVCLADVPIDDPGREALIDAILAHAMEHGELQEAKRAGLIDTADTPRKLIVNHRLLLLNNQWELAAEVERQFIRTFSAHPLRYEILLAMAQRAIHSGHHEEGLDIANQAVELHPNSSKALLQKARALESLNRRDEALHTFQMILDLEPGHPIASREVHREQLGEKERAFDLHLTATGIRNPS